MTLITVTHIALAIILFFSINFLGKNIPSYFGYYQLTTFTIKEEAPAFNFIYRVLTPIVYIIIVSTILYWLNLDKYVSDIYMVSIYYVFGRALFNIVYNRSALINWKRYFLYSTAIIAISKLLYDKIIVTKSNLLPDFNTIANELWIIILVFLYQLLNSIEVSGKGSSKRQKRFLQLQFSRINRKYSSTIQKETDNERLRQIALAIIIFESFNRPFIIRMLEYALHFISPKPHTLGIMQVKTSKFIGDKKSVELGVKKLLSDFLKLKTQYLADNEAYYEESSKDWKYQKKLIEKFNPDLTYAFEVITLADTINSEYFYRSSTNLFSK